jgi:hypothetical protein
MADERFLCPNFFFHWQSSFCQTLSFKVLSMQATPYQEYRHLHLRFASQSPVSHQAMDTLRGQCPEWLLSSKIFLPGPVPVTGPVGAAVTMSES